MQVMEEPDVLPRSTRTISFCFGTSVLLSLLPVDFFSVIALVFILLSTIMFLSGNSCVKKIITSSSSRIMLIKTTAKLQDISRVFLLLPSAVKVVKCVI